MTTKKFTKHVFSLIFIASLVLACSKEDGQDGATGPAGPQGEQGIAGANGADGADGEQGEQGETGTANVIYSDWFPVDYILPGAQDENLMGLEVFNDSELNPLTDVVLVYGQRDTDSDADGIYPLPFILPSQNEYYAFALFDVSGGTGLQVRVSTLDGGTNIFTFFNNYRYVIIPGGHSEAGNTGPGGLGGKSATVDYTKMSYKEITSFFNIPE